VEGGAGGDAMTLHARPKSLRPDAAGLIHLDRHSCFAQLLLTLSASEDFPSKRSTLEARLPFSMQSVRDSLGTLCAHGFAKRVRGAYYVRTWGQVPGGGQ
jgi:hypothetical protein